MKSTRLGCFTLPAIMASVLTALIITGFAFASGGELFSPGPLNVRAGAALGGVSSHAGIAGQCSLCHAPFWGAETMADRCVVCHTDVAAQWQDPSTLHGVLRQNNPNLACRNCHPDHRGPDSPLIDLEDARFPHNTFGFMLTSHKLKTDGSPFTCNDCHAQVYTSFDQNICATCHQQVDAVFTQAHTLAFGTDCLACHDGVDTYGHKFDHNKQTFQLIGKHADVICTGCHLNARSLADLRSAPQDCYSCHAQDDNHQGRFGADCGACHTPAGWSPATFDHNLSTFKLTGQHVNVACENCHLNHVFQGTPTDCYSCHAAKDAHQGRLGTNCGTCHTTAGWLPATFDHNLSTFKLTGQHTSVACESCHINKIYRGTPTDCYACHAAKDAHKGRLGTACGTCHTPAGWTPATFNHNLSTFKLTGQHTSVACLGCHVNNVFQGTPADCYSCHAAQDTHNGQFGTTCGTCHTPAGWIPATFDHNLSAFKLDGQHVTVACLNCHVNNVFRGTPSNCYACHAARDAHNGQFGTACGACHTTAGWTPAFFDHNLSAFKLTGQHVNVNCTSCHINNVFQGTPSNCYSCHAAQDAHGGQFGTNCGSCHSTSGWTPASFDHSISGFPLTGAHTSLSCSQCHSSGVYSGLSTACVACHAEPAVHAGQFGTDCAQCHSTSNWNASINHPNTCDGNCASHRNATCADCHPSGYSSYTCLKCHDSNTPGDGGGGD